MRTVVERATSSEGHDVAELLVRCGQGDQSAAASLYDSIKDRVYGLAVRVLRDRAQAEEVTHDAFIEVWRSASRFDPSKGTGQAWILTIAHRKAVDRVRSATAATKRDAKHYQLSHAVAHDSTSELALRNVEAQRVRLALSRLRPLQRRAIELAYFEGLTSREVAQVLRIPQGTAKTRIRDGLIRLRDEWTKAA